MTWKPRLTAEEVLTLQNDTMKFYLSQQGFEYAVGFADQIYKSVKDQSVHLWEESVWEQMRNGELGHHEASTLQSAPTYLVLDEMCELVEHAAQSIEMQTLRSVDLPTESGFVWFNRPFYIADRHKRRLNVAAVSWHPLHIELFDANNDKARATALFISLYTDTTDPNDAMNVEIANLDVSLPRLSLMHCQPLWLDDVGYLEDGTVIQFEQQKWIAPENPAEHDDGPVINPVMMMHSFWTLIRQRLSHTEVVQGGDRASRKRIERLKLSRPSEINVVTLRRVYEYEKKHGEKADSNYAHRWMVSGHWRNQWYSSIEEHRQVWIEPYEKGPEGTDLVLKPKVIRWSK